MTRRPSPIEEDGEALFGPLSAGLDAVSGTEVVRFVKYVKIVLPLDGFVFWFRSGEFVASGSLHYSTDRYQREDETIAVNRITFTAQQRIEEFSEPDPGSIYVGEYDGLKFSFSSRGRLFQQAGLYHYAGDAVYPALATQLIDDPAQIDTRVAIVSNSLPAWLALKSYSPFWLAPLNPGITLYPSFAVPDNIPPPYGSVHIEPTETKTWQAAPQFDRNWSHYQMASDHVRITLYGCNNNTALDFQDLVMHYSYYTDQFGIMNMPAVRDDKRTQSELVILAQKKTIDYEVSYFQQRMNDIARQEIEKAAASFFPQRTIAGVSI